MFSNKFAALSNKKGPKTPTSTTTKPASPKTDAAATKTPAKVEKKVEAAPVKSTGVVSLAQLKKEAKIAAAAAAAAPVAAPEPEEVKEEEVAAPVEAVEGEAVETKPAAPVVVQKTMKEVEEERKKNAIVIEKKARKADKVTEKFSVVHKEGEEVKVTVKPAEKPAPVAPKKGAVKAPAKPAPKQQQKPKEEKAQVLSLGEFKAVPVAESANNGRGRGGYRGRGGRGGYRGEKPLNVASPKDFPSL